MTLFVLPKLGHDIVLGMDFLAKYNPRVDFAARVITFADGLRVASDCTGNADVSPSDAAIDTNTASVELCSL